MRATLGREVIAGFDTGYVVDQNAGEVRKFADIHYDYALGAITGGKHYWGNQANGSGSFVGNGGGNLASGNNDFVGAGSLNQITSTWGQNAIIGGSTNSITSTAGMTNNQRSFIGGGALNVLNGTGGNQASAIVGGYQNKIYDGASVAIGGGYRNVIGGTFAAPVGAATDTQYTTIAGGRENEIHRGNYAAIAGGYGNRVIGRTAGDGGYNFIGGGGANLIDTSIAASNGAGMNGIVSGANNRIATIGAGTSQTIARSVIGGGGENFILSQQPSAGLIGVTISGGVSNVSNNATYSAISGGYNNRINGGTAAIASGPGYIVGTVYASRFSAIGGGHSNRIEAYASNVGPYAVVGGGRDNRILNGYGASTNGAYNFIGGGFSSRIDLSLDTAPLAAAAGESNSIVGGRDNRILALGVGTDIRYNSIGAGASNEISGNAGTYYSTISGGGINLITQTGAVGGVSQYNFVGGGNANKITQTQTAGAFQHSYNTIAGGWINEIRQLTPDSLGTGGRNTISGGYNNIIEQIGVGSYSNTIAGGQSNLIKGSYSSSAIGGGLSNQITSTRAAATHNTNTLGGNAIVGGQANIVRSSTPNTGDTRWNTLGGWGNVIENSQSSTALGQLNTIGSVNAGALAASFAAGGSNTITIDPAATSTQTANAFAIGGNNTIVGSAGTGVNMALGRSNLIQGLDRIAIGVGVTATNTTGATDNLGIVIGGPTNKLGFYNAQPVARRVTTAAAIDLATVIALANDMRTGLIALGLLA